MRFLPPRTLLVWLLILAAGGGCVRRRLTIVSNPPGALVYVDEHEIGLTPVSAPFTYYGGRNVRVVKDGYETVTQVSQLDPPWYQLPVIEFFAENLWPGELRDERVLHFDLPPQQNVPNQQLLERATALRDNARTGVVTPLSPVRSGETLPLAPPSDGLSAPPGGPAAEPIPAPRGF